MALSLTKQAIISLLLLGLLFLILVFSIRFEGRAVEWLRVIVGSISLLFIPWYRTTRALFVDTELDQLETFALSFAFSISVIPLIVFYVNLMGIPISQRLVFGELIIVSIAAISRVAYVKTPRGKTIVMTREDGFQPKQINP